MTEPSPGAISLEEWRRRLMALKDPLAVRLVVLFTAFSPGVSGDTRHTALRDVFGVSADRLDAALEEIAANGLATRDVLQ